MRLVYLVNHYPKVSHAFIRREVEALERLGANIERVSLRGWDDVLVDPADRSERSKTRYVLQRGMIGLAAAVVSQLLSSPRRFFKVFGLATRQAKHSLRPLVVHWAYFAEACVIARWVGEARADHLHAHFGTNSAEVAMLAAELSGRSWSFTAHGSAEIDGGRSLGFEEKFRRAAFVIAVCSYVRSQLLRWVSHSHWSKCRVVHCGFDPSFRQAGASLRPELNRLVCVGRLCNQKGQLLLLTAVRRLLDSGIECELVLAGDGEMRAAIEAAIAQLALQKHVRITGWISTEQVREEILRSRALVLPSFIEGLPVVIMEAMALGRPVVSTFVGGIPELVEHGVNGWLCPAGDVEALVEVMRHCLALDERELAAFGARAAERATSRHDVDVEAGRLLEMFAAEVRRHA